MFYSLLNFFPGDEFTHIRVVIDRHNIAWEIIILIKYQKNVQGRVHFRKIIIIQFTYQKRARAPSLWCIDLWLHHSHVKRRTRRTVTTKKVKLSIKQCSNVRHLEKNTRHFMCYCVRSHDDSNVIFHNIVYIFNLLSFGM